MAAPRPQISVVVPCFQEEESLPLLARSLGPWLEELGAELVLVDDGSTDGTAAAGRRLFPRARHLRHPANRGLGAALRTGSLAARGDLIAWLDADASYDPALLPRMRNLLEESGAAAVTLSPWHPRGTSTGLSPLRAAPSRVLSRLYRLLAPGRLWTYTAMVRIHRREALLPALPGRDGFPGVTESLLRILVGGGRVVELPATLETRRRGRSKLAFWPVLAGHLELLTALALGRLEKPAPESRADREG